MADFPKDLKYTKEHEWARFEGGRARVGITQHAVDQLGDVTLVDLKVKAGSALASGKDFGVVESVKTVSDLYAPMDGTVVEVNAALDKSPELLNSDPYGEGWMVVIETADTGAGLMDADAYAKFVANG